MHRTPAPGEYRQVVITGGPGAGKTAVLETIKRVLCDHVFVVPEAATIVFGGGFPRAHDVGAREASQLAIAAVQRQLEAYARSRETVGFGLCDRGTIDGLAYWPGEPARLWQQMGTTYEQELARYAAVIHLHSPDAETGYDHSNRVRIESAREAQRIDTAIARAWDGHPRRFFVAARANFLEKTREALRLIRAELPVCCREHRIPELDD